MNKRSIGLWVVLFSIVLAVFLVLDGKNKESKIQRWATQNGYQILRIEESYFNTGQPYTVKDQGDRIYRVKVRRNNRDRTFWFRINRATEFTEE